MAAQNGQLHMVVFLLTNGGARLDLTNAPADSKKAHNNAEAEAKAETESETKAEAESESESDFEDSAKDPIKEAAKGKNAVYLAALYGHTQVLAFLLQVYALANIELDTTMILPDLSSEIDAFVGEISEKTMLAQNIRRCGRLVKNAADASKLTTAQSSSPLLLSPVLASGIEDAAKKQLKRNRADDPAASLEQNNPHPGKQQKKTSEAGLKSDELPLNTRPLKRKQDEPSVLQSESVAKPQRTLRFFEQSASASSSSASSPSASFVPRVASTSSWSAVSSSSSSSSSSAPITRPLAYSYSALASASASTATSSAAASSSSSSFSASAFAHSSRKPDERQLSRRSKLRPSGQRSTAFHLDIAKLKREISLINHEAFKEEFHKQIADWELNLETVREKTKLLLLDLPAQLASYGKPLNGEDSTRINQLFVNYFLEEKDETKNKHASTGQATRSGLKKF